MSRLTNSALRLVAVSAAMLWCTTTIADSAPAVFITTDINKDVVKVNFECPVPGECAMLEERINEANLKYPQDVEVGSKNGRTYAMVSSGTYRKPRIDLFTPNDPGEFWTRMNLDTARGNALVLTAPGGALYAGSNENWRSNLYRYRPDMCEGDITPNCWNTRELVTEIKVDGYRCLKVVDLTEFPVGSGKLIATCKFPQAAIEIDPVNDTQQVILGPHDFPWAPTGADVVNIDGNDYLLFSTVYRKLLAYRRDGADWVRQQKPVINLKGYLGGVSTGLCTDGGPCASVSNSGNGGRLNLVSLAINSAGDVAGTVEQVANNQLALPGSGSFANVVEASSEDCQGSSGCPLSISTVHIPLSIPPGVSVGGQTLGSYQDPRYNGMGNCSDERLDLGAVTGIAALNGRFVGPEFCARNDGQFFVEAISIDSSLSEGTIEATADGECFATGFDDAFNPDVLSLADTNYGLRDPELDDRFVEDDDEVNDTLFDCTNPRRRGGASLSYFLEGFFGRFEFGVGTPAELVYPYGNKVLNESLANLRGSDSKCSSTSSAACARVETDFAQASVGWNLQDDGDLNVSEVVLMTSYQPVSGNTGTLENAIPGTGIDLTVTASGGDLGYKSINDGTTNWTALGVDGEILLNQSLTYTASSDDAGAQVDGVPFEVPSFTVAFLFDGPEFGDVEEVMRVEGTRADGTKFTGDLQIKFDSMPMWSPGGATIDELSPATQGGAAVYRVTNPFGDEDFVSLKFEPQRVDYANGCPNGGSCSNQSDGSVYDLEIAVVDRIDALKFAYDGLRASLCDTSTRPDAKRPPECGGAGPFVGDFNIANGRNTAGRLQIVAESFARFITQNICLLDETPGFDPAFCETPQPWSDIAP